MMILCSVCLRLTGLDAAVVLELVASGTLALQLPVGHGYNRGTVWADTGVSVAGLRQTQQAARLVGTGIMAWWTVDLSLSMKGTQLPNIIVFKLSVPHLCSSPYRRS